MNLAQTLSLLVVMAVMCLMVGADMRCTHGLRADMAAQALTEKADHNDEIHAIDLWRKAFERAVNQP